MANKSGRRSSWLELELTVTTIKPVTVRSNLNYYSSSVKNHGIPGIGFQVIICHCVEGVAAGPVFNEYGY
jgi:hypothetical protein